MAVTNVNLAVPAGWSMYTNTDCDGTKDSVKASAGTIYSIIIDNLLNSAVEYVKFWALALGSVTVGTTAPDMIIEVQASTKLELTFPTGNAFLNALTIACVTTGGTAGTTNPTNNVTVTVLYT